MIADRTYLEMFIYLATTLIITSVGTQILKIIFKAVITKKISFKNFTTDGGFPSSHTAFSVSMCSLAWFFTLHLIYIKADFNLTALSMILSGISTNHTCITIRDALGVRRTVQILCYYVQHIAITNKEVVELFNKKVKYTDNSAVAQIQKNFDFIAKNLNIKSGHLPHEVIGGAFWGILVASTTSSYFYGFKNLFFLCIITIIIFIIAMSIFLKSGQKAIERFNKKCSGK